MTFDHGVGGSGEFQYGGKDDDDGGGFVDCGGAVGRAEPTVACLIAIRGAGLSIWPMRSTMHSYLTTRSAIKTSLVAMTDGHCWGGTLTQMVLRRRLPT